MHGLVYISAPALNLTEDDVQQILAVARAKNEKLDVTGVLLYSVNLFIQVLEGPADVLDDLMQSITNDPRHEDVTVLVREPIQSRIYDDWTMAYRYLEAEPMNHLCGEIGWDTAMQKLSAFPRHRSMAFLMTSITSIVGSLDAA